MSYRVFCYQIFSWPACVTDTTVVLPALSRLMKVVNTGSLFMLGKVTLEALQWAQLALWGFSQCTAGTLELFKGHNWHFGGFSEGTAGTLEVIQRAQLALWRLLRGHSWHPGCFTEGTASTLGVFTEFTAVNFTGFCLTRFKRWLTGKVEWVNLISFFIAQNQAERCSRQRWVRQSAVRDSAESKWSAVQYNSNRCLGQSWVTETALSQKNVVYDFNIL